MDTLVFFSHEYDEKDWNKYAECFPKAEMAIGGIPKDIINVVVGLFGESGGIRWLHSPLSKFDGKSAVELVKTEEGERALKAFIMRLPN